MVRISPVVANDRIEWLRLWNGYLSFYETRLAETVTAVTFERIIDPASEIHGAIARDDASRAIGLVHWLTHPATWTDSCYCYLEDLFVAPDARGSGAGRALIEHVVRWAEANDASKVYWLTAETNQTARGLYDRVASRSGMIQYQVQLTPGSA